MHLFLSVRPVRAERNGRAFAERPARRAASEMGPAGIRLRRHGGTDEGKSVDIGAGNRHRFRLYRHRQNSARLYGRRNGRFGAGPVGRLQGARKCVRDPKVKSHAAQTEETTEVGLLMCQNVKTRFGFTLIELMIVLVIMGVAAAIAVPMISSAGSMQIRAASNMLAADLEYAKSAAISRGEYFSVVFDKTTETYRIEDENGAVISHPVRKQFDYEVNFQEESRLNRVDIVDADFDGASAVTFDYLGSPSSGTPGSLAPLNSGVVTLEAGGITKTVSVEPVTGFVSISD